MVDQKTQELLARIEHWLSQKHELSKGEVIKENHVVVLINDHQYGPLSSNDLKEIAKYEPSALSLLLFREDNELPWNLLAEHPAFNRRQETGLAGPAILDSNEFYHLKNGIKHGPYKFQDLEQMITAKVISYTDHISLDNGQNWVYLYQLERFDRRDQNSEDLPHLPKLEIFDQSEIDAHENKYEREVDEDLSQMSQLIQKTEVIKSNVPETTSIPFQLSPKKWGAIAGVAILIFSLFLFRGKEESVRAPASSINNEAAAQEQDSMKMQQSEKVKKKSTTTKRSFERRPPTTSKPTQTKSFTESEAFKSSREKLGEHMREEIEDTADNEDIDPYEYDPVRSKVSKETMDRINDNENIDDLDRAPASEESPWPAAEETQRPEIEEAEAIDF